MSSAIRVSKVLLLALTIGVYSASAQGKNGLASLDFREVIRDSKNRVFPAVVYIKCVRETHTQGKKQSMVVSGSGVLISADGELLTNWHVIDKATEIRCLLYDGRSFYAKAVGKDRDLDVALLRLERDDPSEKTPFAKLGPSLELKEGDFVMAMGAPWGMARSVSIGIISCTRRILEGHSEYSLWLQTDASISPGNSGGPLVSTDGEVIGINTRGISYGGDMGFSVPSDTIKEIIPRLRQNGDVAWSWTGLELQAIRDFNLNVYFEGKDGVIVAGTTPGGPARKAGVLDRDRILSIGGKKVNGFTEEDLPDIDRMMGLLPVDKPVKLEILREGKNISIDLTPRLKGKVEGDELDCPRWDLTVKAINQFDNRDLYFHKKEGVFIYGIKYPGNASTARLRRNDIIIEIDGEKVVALEDIERIHKRTIDNVNLKPRVLFKILRNGMIQQLVLDFSHDYERE